MAKKRPTKRPAPKGGTPDDLLTTAQVAEMAGLHPFHLARLLREGKGPKSIRIGATQKHPGHHVIRRADAAAWIESR